MRDIGHFIAGKPVAGTSGKFGDVFNPAAGEVSGRVALADAAEVNKAVAAAAAAWPAWAATPPLRRARVMFKLKELLERDRRELVRDHHRRARQGAVGRRWRGAARPGGGGVRLRHPASAEGRVHRSRRHRHRRLVDPPAARRGRRHHAVQLPADGAAVDDPGGARLRQLLHPEAVREGPVRVAEAGRAAGRGRRAGRRVQGGAGRARGGRGDPGASRHRRGQLRRLHRDRRDDLSGRHVARQARAGAGRGEEPPGGDAGRRHRRCGGRADGLGLRRGGRALHGGVGRGGGGIGRRPAGAEAGAAGARAEDRAGHRSRRRDGPAGHARAPREGARATSTSA